MSDMIILQENPTNVTILDQSNRVTVVETNQPVTVNEVNNTVTVTENVNSITVSSVGTQGAAGATNHGALTGLSDDDHGQYHNDARALSWLGTRSTSDVNEGINLFHTDERVDDRAASLLQNGTGISWSYDDGAGTLTPAISLASFATTDLTEGTNLYHTSARVQAESVGGDLTGSIANAQVLDDSHSHTTATITLASTDLTDTADLVYEAELNEKIDDQAAALIQDGGGINWTYDDGANTLTPAVSLSSFTTTDLAEGTNLYHTDARSDARISAQKAAANGLATLGSDSKIPTNQLPAIVLVDVNVVANEAAQLALSVQEEGDVAVRVDENKSYIHNGGSAGTMADWTELLTPTDAVLSVNGSTGSIVLTTSDVSEGTNLYHTDERVDDRVSTLLQDAGGVTWSYDDASGTLTPAVDHGALSGLADDDHAQYHNDARALSWLGSRSTTDLSEGTNQYYTDAKVDTHLTGGDGITYSAGAISADYNVTNLKITSGEINTVQDIATSSSPTFTGATLSGITQGSVVFAGLGGVLSQDNSAFFWDDGNNRLGIGTASPDRPLTILGTSGGDLMSFKDNATSTTQWHMRLQGAGDGDLGFTESGVTDDRFVLYAGGDVSFDGGGMYYTSSTSNLKLTSTGDVSLTLEADTDNSGEGDQPSIVFIQDGGAVTGVLGYIDSNNDLILKNRYASADLRLGANNADVVWIDQSGSVGIGASPETQFKLDVAGKLNYSPVGCSVYRSSAQSISHATDTTISWNAETDDTDGFHSTSSNTDRITIPSGLGGKYMVECTIIYATLGSTGVNQVVIAKNGNTSILNNPNAANASAGGSTVSGVIDLADGDYIRARVYQSSGASRNLNSGSADTRLSCWRMGEVS